MSNNLTDVFVKGVSGVLTRCSLCDQWIAIDTNPNTPDSKECILHKTVCPNYHSATIGEGVN